MKTSQFQFSNPVLKKLDFQVNSNFKPEAQSEVAVSLKFNVNIHRDSQNPRAIVELTVIIGDDADSPFKITVMESAKFRWDSELDEDHVDFLLNKNAPAVLISYIRPTISVITAASPFSAYNLPLIDFASEEAQDYIEE